MPRVLIRIPALYRSIYLPNSRHKFTMVNIQEIIAQINSKRKSNFPWRRQESYIQPYFHFDSNNKKWQEVKSSSSTSAANAGPISKFSVLSWNIDFMLPFGDKRMQVAVDHVQSLVSQTAWPSIIFFNEMLVSDLELLRRQEWIQQNYHLTDIDSEYWESGHYGTCTLVSNSFNIKQVFRVHYEATKMERDGLFVDIETGKQDKVLRVCNSHLESLVADPPLRPKQVETAAGFLHEQGVIGGLMGGDFNAIQDFDRNLHSDNQLKDAYLEKGGKEDTDEGHTWGQMAAVKQREMFGCSRMDKIFFTGRLEVDKFERFGLWVEVDDAKIKKALVDDEGMDGGWVTDHAGVRADFRFVETDEAKVTPKI